MDVIDELAGIAPGSPLDAIRARRPVARAEAEASHRALFAPNEPGHFTPAERFAVAGFVAGLHGESVPFYMAPLAEYPELRAAVEAAIAAGRGTGPQGTYPAGPLSREDSPVPVWRLEAGASEALGPRLTAAFEHLHMLVLHPRDASAASLQSLLDAGWSTTEIVTLSQIASFLAFQLRAVAGLRVLAGSL